jgi:hypothetical protein
MTAWEGVEFCFLEETEAMKKLVAAALVAALAGVAITAHAGHGMGSRDDDGKGKKHGKKHPKADKGEDKGTAQPDKKDEPKK